MWWGGGGGGCCFFFFKQKTAYEIYQCDWSSDVCSSDLWNDKRKKYIKLKIHYDHFVPWVYSGDNSGPNISASCHICNSLKSDNHFYDLISAKEYLNAKRIRRGYV